MPKISDTRRAERRAQILDAARRCFQRDGLHATTMADIIAESGLSSGAVYGYFRSKDELIVAALYAALSGLQASLDPLLRRAPALSPDGLVREVAAAIDAYSARDGYDLRRIAVLGWGEAQRNEPVRATMRGFYAAFRDQLAAVAAAWRRAGVLPAAGAAADDDVAKALMAVVLGYVAEAAILGDVGPDAVAGGIRQLGGPPGG